MKKYSRGRKNIEILVLRMKNTYAERKRILVLRMKESSCGGKHRNNCAEDERMLKSRKA
jgi:hypothetical protein